MTATEIQKLIIAGFTVIQVRENHKENHEHELTIWQKTPEHHEWHMRDKTVYTTKASCKKDFAHLLKWDKIIDLFDCLHAML